MMYRCIKNIQNVFSNEKVVKSVQLAIISVDKSLYSGMFMGTKVPIGGKTQSLCWHFNPDLCDHAVCHRCYHWVLC